MTEGSGQRRTTGLTLEELQARHTAVQFSNGTSASAKKGTAAGAATQGSGSGKGSGTSQ
ncbi:hypothetical protein LTS18_007890, partial [Coniosporium uncinatum]